MTWPGESSLLLLVDSLAASAAFRRFVSVIMMSSFQIWHYSTHFLHRFWMIFSVFSTQFFLFCQSINLHFFCFSAQQKFWTLWLTNNGRLYPWKKGILITAFGQDDNFDITLFILWRHNLISTVLLQLTVGFRLGLLHQQSQGAHCLASTARSSPHKNSLSHFSCLHSALGNKGKEVINTIKRTNAAIILFKSYIIWPIILIVTVLNWSLHSKKADICVWKG